MHNVFGVIAQCLDDRGNVFMSRQHYVIQMFVVSVTEVVVKRATYFLWVQAIRQFEGFSLSVNVFVLHVCTCTYAGLRTENEARGVGAK